MNKQVLVAKITPEPKAYISNQDLLAAPIVIDCDYMLSFARPYMLGSTATNFQVQFGKLESNEQKEIFVAYLSKELFLTSEELSTWGIDDEMCYSIIAQKVGVNCVSFKQVFL